MMFPWSWVTIAAVMLGLGAYGLYMRSERDSVRAEYAEYRTQVARAAQEAADQALKRTIADEQRREKVDADHARKVASLAADLGRLRRERDDARREFLSSSSSGSPRPDLVCFDRAEYLAAYRDLVSEVRGAGDEGTAATVDLDAAKAWAQP